MESFKQQRKYLVLHFILFFLFITACSHKKFLPDHSRVPGVVIDYSPAYTQRYIGSPSLAILPNGDYIASHDFFGKGSAYNKTRIHRSRDRGKNWNLISEIDGQFWSTLFYHRGALYLIGTSQQNGYAIIRRSTDGGVTWTNPIDLEHGLLLADGEYHCAPVPVVEYRGRLWRAMEDRNPPEGWGRNFRSFVMSVPVDADLLNAQNWTFSNRLRYNQEWPGSAWLEGNIVITSEGKIVNILRNHTETGGKACMIQVSDDGTQISFDPEIGFIDFPGGCKKFTIRYDSLTHQYWALSNVVLDQHKGGNPERTRNTLALISSTNLRNWQIRSIILYHPDVKKVGFQYADWLIEGSDIVTVVRTAYDDGIGGAHNCHDANYLTFHRIPKFRNRTLTDEPLNGPLPFTFK